MWRLCSGFTPATIYDLQIPACIFFLFSFVLYVFCIWGMNTYPFAELLHSSKWCSLRPPTLLSSVDQSFASQAEIVSLSLFHSLTHSLSLSFFCPSIYSTPFSLCRPPTGIHLRCIKPRHADGGRQPRKTREMDQAWALHHNGEPSQGRFPVRLNVRSHLKKPARMHTCLLACTFAQTFICAL